MKISTGVELRDIIMDVKLKSEKFQGFCFDVIGGQNSPFPVDYVLGPYHSALVRTLI